jgi:uroporphyrinogen-III decarboxylase
MNEILLKALCNQPTSRVPWVPFVGLHGGALVGVDATDYLKSADHIVHGLEAAVKRYRADGLPVVYDLQLEAAYIDADIDVIAVVDPMISQIGPEHFRDFVTPALNKVFDYTRERGALSSLFVCGNATRDIEAMTETTCDNISIDENVDLALLAKTCRAAAKNQ